MWAGSYWAASPVHPEPQPSLDHSQTAKQEKFQVRNPLKGREHIPHPD